jgi:hypothetical protein
MHELDNYYAQELKAIEEDINIKEERQDNYLHPKYNYISKRKSLLGFSKAKLNEFYHEQGPRSEAYLNFKKRYQRLKREYKELDKQQRKLPARYTRKQTLRSYYVKYADNWIILTNGTVKYADFLKQLIGEFLETQLKLILSTTKTKVTDIRKEHARFLGFQILAPTLVDIHWLSSFI